MDYLFNILAIWPERLARLGTRDQTGRGRNTRTGRRKGASGYVGMVHVGTSEL